MEVFGPYVLFDRLAAGGMGEVFCAAPRDPPFRLLAVKRALPHLAHDASLAQAMMDEASIVTRLVHPNILPVLDVGQVDGRYYLAMEYVHGVTLAQLLAAMNGAGTPVHPALVVAVARGVLSALAYAHGRADSGGHPMGIIHRDVSPQNIMVSHDGRVLLTDFGIARASVRAARTTTGVIKGKVAYLAPEQLAGGGVDHRADLYAVGVVMWEMLAGAPMRQAQTEAELLGRVLRGEVPPFPPQRVAMPALHHALDRALAAAPSQRVADASQFVQMLADITPPSQDLAVARDAVLGHFPDLGHQPSADAAWESGWARLRNGRSPRKARTLTVLAAVAGCALVAAGSSVLVRRWRAPHPVASAALPRPPARAQTTPPPPDPTADATVPTESAPPAAPPAATPHKNRPGRTADATPGLVNLQSRPWARIHVDGHDTGRFTPVHQLRVPPGRHHIRLVNDEMHMADEFDVDVQAGRTQNISRTLK